MDWVIVHPKCTREMLGYLPGFLDPDDPRPAKEQFNERYAHGGGWRPFSEFEMASDLHELVFPAAYEPFFQPAEHYPALALTMLREELIIIYAHAWVAIIQKDGSYEVARMD